MTGENSTIISRIIGATRLANGSGKVIASVFGSTSPKTSTSAVIPMVASATPLSPKSRVKSAVASEADRMLTMLLPKSSAPIIRSRSSVTFIAAAAPSEPRSACDFSLAREAAVSAVSEPEKKADASRRMPMAAVVIQKAVSMGSCGWVSVSGGGPCGPADGGSAPGP